MDNNMKPETQTKLKIGETIIDVQDLEYEEKVAFIEFAIHIAAPKIAQILVEKIEKVGAKTTEHDNLLFEMPPTLTVREVADYLRVSTSKVYEMCQRYHGKFFPHFKVGNRYKIPCDKFVEWLNNGGLGYYEQQVTSEDVMLQKQIKQQNAVNVRRNLEKKSKPIILKQKEPERKTRLTKKEAADYLKVSTSTMLRMLKDKNIFHYKINNQYIIPLKAIEAYVASKGKATWNEQLIRFSEYEPRLSEYDILSLPTIKPDNATKQVKCPMCGTECWHNEFTENMKEYKANCYKCVLKIEGIT